MKNLRFVDDKSATKATVVKMTCDCGWTEKAFATRDARSRGENHLRTKHNGGLMHYNGHTIEVKGS